MRNHSSLSTIRLSSAALPALYFCSRSLARRTSSSPMAGSAAAVKYVPSGCPVCPPVCPVRLCSICTMGFSVLPAAGSPALICCPAALPVPGAASASRRGSGCRVCCIPCAIMAASCAACIMRFSSCGIPPPGCCARSFFFAMPFSFPAYTLITRVGLLRTSISSGSSCSTGTCSVLRGLIGFSISTYRHSS